MVATLFLNAIRQQSYLNSNIILKGLMEIS